MTDVFKLFPSPPTWSRTSQTTSQVSTNTYLSEPSLLPLSATNWKPVQDSSWLVLCRSDWRRRTSPERLSEPWNWRSGSALLLMFNSLSSQTQVEIYQTRLCFGLWETPGTPGTQTLYSPQLQGSISWFWLKPFELRPGNMSSPEEQVLQVWINKILNRWRFLLLLGTAALLPTVRARCR